MHSNRTTRSWATALITALIVYVVATIGLNLSPLPGPYHANAQHIAVTRSVQVLNEGSY